jgi:hypothetical protein
MVAEVVRRLKAAAIHVAGLLQEGRSGSASSCASLILEDIATGRRIQAFERRGAQARGCRLDSSGLAVAAGWIREALVAKPDILFINRFGRQESEGRGLLGEICAAATAGIPMVVIVSKALLPKWHAFAGEEGGPIVTSLEQLEGWCFDAVRQTTVSSGMAHEDSNGGTECRQKDRIPHRTP